MTTVTALIMDTVTRPMGTVIHLMDFMAGAPDIPPVVTVNIIPKGGDMERVVIVGVAMVVECPSAVAIAVAEYPALGVAMVAE